MGCYTGLRYSDYSRLTNDNISEGKYIKVVQQKTGSEVVIPLLPYVRDLIKSKRLEEVLNIPDWKINRDIKGICQKAEINDKVIRVQTKGGKRQQITAEKWQEVGTHGKENICNKYVFTGYSSNYHNEDNGTQDGNSVFTLYQDNKQGKCRFIGGNTTKQHTEQQGQNKKLNTYKLNTKTK